MDKEKLIKFWKSLIYLDEIKHFLKDSSTLKDTAFFRNLAHISGKTATSTTSATSFTKNISWMYLWARKPTPNFGSHPNRESGLGL